MTYPLPSKAALIPLFCFLSLHGMQPSIEIARARQVADAIERYKGSKREALSEESTLDRDSKRQRATREEEHKQLIQRVRFHIDPQALWTFYKKFKIHSGRVDTISFLGDTNAISSSIEIDKKEQAAVRWNINDGVIINNSVDFSLCQRSIPETLLPKLSAAFLDFDISSDETRSVIIRPNKSNSKKTVYSVKDPAQQGSLMSAIRFSPDNNYIIMGAWEP